MAGTQKSLGMWAESGGHLLGCQAFADGIIAGGEGCYLIDVDGNRILDLAAGQFCNLLGYNHPALTERVAAQIRRAVHTPDQMLADVVLECAAALAGVAPVPNGRCLLLSTGSEANECTLRAAKILTRRTGTLGFDRGYYGISLATRNISRISLTYGRHDFQPVPPDAYHLLAPDCRHCPLGLCRPQCDLRCLATSLELLGEFIRDVAAVFIEPVLSAGGMIFPPEDYVRRLAEIARLNGTIFVADEAQTGFARTGKWFCIEHYGVQPDIVVISKGAGAGYPVSGMIVSESVADRLAEAGFTHLSSHQNDPLAAAALLGLIEAVRAEGLVERAAATGETFVTRLRQLQTAWPRRIADVRGRGLMIGMELAESEEDGESPASLFARLCAARGVHVTYAYDDRTVRLIPPLVIGPREMNHAIETFDAVFRDIESGVGGTDQGLPTNPVAATLRRHWHARFPWRRYLHRMWETSPAEWFARLRRRGGAAKP